MIEVFNAITNIAEDIEKDVFQSCTDFLDLNKSDEQIHADVYGHCRTIIRDEFKKVKSIKGMMGRRSKELTSLNDNGKYIVCYTTIDNVDLLDVDFSLGSIFAIYENELGAKNLKAAIYITYGPTFQLVFATENEGVKFFTHEGNDFVQQESFTLSEKGKINSTAGIQREWSKEHKELIESFFTDGYRLRFSDSLSLDTHQILFKKGGIYSSPATRTHPKGQLHLLFEAYPIAFIMELAGGAATNGQQRILDIVHQDAFQKTPIYFGSKSEIERVKEYIK